MIELLPLEYTMYFMIGTLFGIALMVLKYAPLRTKLLWIIANFMLYGLFISEISKYFGYILIVIGAILSSIYVAKAIRDLIPNI